MPITSRSVDSLPQLSYLILVTQVVKMPQCFVSTCRNYYNKTRGSSSVSYHSFPTSPTRAQKWLQLCGRSEATRLHFARICSAHFSPKCYRRDLKHELLGLPLRKKLEPDAVPDINLPSQSSTVHTTDNKVSGNFRKAKVKKCPMQPNIGIVKTHSIQSCEALSGDSDRKVFHNSTNKRRELNLKHINTESVKKLANILSRTADATTSKTNVVRR